MGYGACKCKVTLCDYKFHRNRGQCQWTQVIRYKDKEIQPKNTVPVYFQFSKKAQTREEQVVFSPTQMPMVRVRSKGNIGNYCVVAVYSVLGWCGGMAWMCEKQ